MNLVDKIKLENVKASKDLEKKLLKEKEDFKKKQEKEQREFEARLLGENEEFKQKQQKERNMSTRKAMQKLKEAVDFIENVKSPSENERIQEEIR